MLKKIVIASLSLSMVVGLAFISSGCGSKNGPVAAEQVFTVQRRNLSIEITGAGNLALARSEDLAFEIAGYVQDVLVKEGDSVQEGQVVAQLDTSEWEKQLKNLQKAVDTAQRGQTSARSNVTKANRNLASIQSNVTKAQRAVTQAESNVVKAQGQVTSKEFALRQAQLDLETAKYNQGQIEEVKAAQANVDGIQNLLDIAKANYRLAQARNTSTPEMPKEIAYYTGQLEQAQSRLQDIIKGNNVNISSSVAIQIAQSQLKVEQSQKSVADAQSAIDDARLAVIDAETEVENAGTAVNNALADVEDAKTAVDNAILDQKNADQNVTEAMNDLEEARNLSPGIVVPFNGYITKVNVSGGDEVQKGTIAMTVADPAKFTADIVVGESDIIKVKEGGTAKVRIDAITGMTLPAAVTHISPTATVQSGVVSYRVTVEMENSQPVSNNAQPQQTPSQGPSPTASTTPVTGRTPARGGLNRGGFTFPGGTAGVPAVSQTSLIRSGMSVTVIIIVDERQNVILVPNQAIVYNGRNSQVQVKKDDAVETRIIKTGINNWQYTEVTEGLSEGEQVVITLAGAGVSTSRTTPASRGQQAPINLPGGGRVIR